MSFRRNAFTLIELLVVIAIIAILSVVVIFTLNPAQLLMQGRDANRISDMNTLNTGLGIYAEDQSSGSLGSLNVVYVSIADPTATSTAGDQCQGLGLVSLPATYSYHCAATSTLRNVNGTGWIPVSFSAISAGSPIGSLPVDPVNQSSSRLYYTYTTNGTQFELTSVMESQKYKLGGVNDVISGDGGTLASVYERGSKLGLEPLDYGDSALAGLWTMDEGTGTVAYDYSGNNATGSWQGSVVNGSHYVAGKIGPYAGNFLGGNSNTVNTTFQYSLTSASNFTWSAWIYYVTSGTGQTTLIGNRYGSTWAKLTPTAFEYTGGIISYAMPTNAWNFVVITKSGSNFNYYLNNVLVGSASNAGTVTNVPFYIGGDQNFPSDGYMTGMVDDARVYNRALSASEIAAMYSGGK